MDWRCVITAPVEPYGGFFGRLWLPLNDVLRVRCGTGCGGDSGRGRVMIFDVILAERGFPIEAHTSCLVDAKTESLRHSEGEARGIPYGGAEGYVTR